MKLNKVLFSLLLTVAFVSCKSEEKKDIKEEKSDYYTLTLNAVINKDDTFQLYFKESNDDKEPFEEVSSVWVNLKGSDIAQDVVFNLPEGVYPTYLRLDLGSNKEQGPMVINEFKVEHLGKAFSVKGTDFFSYFIAEKAYVNFDKANSTAIPFITSEGYYDPMFFSEYGFNAEMVKLAK